MEASQAGLAQNGDGQQNGGGEAQQGPDLAAMAETLGNLSQGQEELRQFLQGQPWQQPPEPAAPEQAPELDLSFIDAEDPTYDPRVAAEHLQQHFQQQLQHGIEEAVSPLQKQLQEMRQETEAERLAYEFPELAEPETAEKVMTLARHYAHNIGHPELADNFGFARLVYMAGRAADAANQEGAQGANAAHLEGAGGPGPAAPQVDLGDLIVNGGGDGRRGRGALPFG